MIRNFIGCIDKDHQGKIFPVLIAEGIVHEIKEIMNALQSYAPENLKLQIYLCTYEDISKQFKNATLKYDGTPKQIEDRKLEESVIKYLLTMIKNIKIHKTDIKGRYGKTLLLSHYSIDLLSADNFLDLKLLESHTGVIKGRSEFKTKLSGAKDINVPFNRTTLQVFGDSSGLFKPRASAVKKALINLSIYNKWHPLTKDDKFEKDIKSADIDSEIKTQLIGLF